MVDGIHMVFSKEYMKRRLVNDGVADIPQDVLDIMDNLDGQEVGTNSWQRVVMGKPVYTCTGKDGKSYDVNEKDCMPLHEYEVVQLYFEKNGKK